MVISVSLSHVSNISKVYTLYKVFSIAVNYPYSEYFFVDPRNQYQQTSCIPERYFISALVVVILRNI